MIGLRRATSTCARRASTADRTRSSATSSRSWSWTCEPSGEAAMNFSLAEEQQLLREALARFIEKEYSFERRRSAVESAAGWSVDAWRALAELGVAGILVPQALGGYGGTMVDAAIVMETLGEGLLVEPFAATAILGATALVSGASAAQQAQLLPGVLRGDTILAWAHGEDGADGERAGTHPSLTTSAERRGDGYVL